MNLIEALKKANGKPITRQWWPNRDLVDTTKSEIQWAKRDEFTRDKNLLSTDNLLADDWYVVEPKSAIEQGIEREAKKFWGELPVGKNTMAELVSMGSRIVNLTLDEAKKAFNPHDCTVVALSNTEISNRIDALKVKD